MTRWKRALVTGASSGIGASIARQLAADGTELVVVARDTARLEALAADLPVAVEVLGADLAHGDDLERVALRLTATEAPVDLLVNNAGFGFVGPYPDLPYEGERDVVAVNVVAVHRLSHAAASAMTRAGGGAILNIASVAGYLPSAGSATYAATKAFVNSFSESLHQDLLGAGVSVTCVCPGFTRTEFQQRADYDGSDIPAFLWQDADDVAKAALRAAARGDARIVTGGLNKVAVGLLKVVPLAVLRPFSRRAARTD